MTYSAKETGAITGAPVELYKFTSAGRSWTFTSGDQEVTYDGATYAPAVIHRTEPEQSQGANPHLTVSVPRDHDVALLFRVYVPASPMALVIYRYHRGDAETIAFWTGKVRAVSWEGSTAKLECEPVSSAMKRDGLRVQYQATCNHMLYGAQCGVSAIAWKTAAIVAAVNGDQITAPEFAGHADGWFKAGFLSYFNDWRMIISHTGDTVTVILPFEGLAAGAAVDAFAGCDRSRTVCKGRFDNLLNYGGFPFIPTKNPFNKGLT